MARLYVLNASGQNRLVNYRLDYTVDDQGRRTSERLVPYKSQMIPARQQMQFGGDLAPMQLQDIVQQLERTCGAVSVQAVRTAKRMGVVRMVWSTDVKIPRSICEDVVAHNMGLLSEQGAQRRERMALAADDQLNHLVDRTTPKFEMEFEQVEDASEDFPERLEEGLRVRRAAPEPSKPPAKRARARRAA